MTKTLLPGRPDPLGATWDGTGVNFALYSENATGVELCLYDNRSRGKRTNQVARDHRLCMALLRSRIAARPALWLSRYGPYEPERGLRFNPAKLLIDPYAQAVCGPVDWKQPIFPYNLNSPEQDLAIDNRDSGPGMPKAVIVNPYFDWDQDRLPRTPLADSIIYEMHVRGFSKLNQELPEPLRGTYAGLASPPSIRYLKELGITAVELMPVHHFIKDKYLVDKGLPNYWGYNTLSFFSPDGTLLLRRRYRVPSRRIQGHGQSAAPGRDRSHPRCGLQPHREGNHLGPMLNLRGIDNTTYYRLTEDKPRYYMDYTGTGNSLNVRHPQVLKLIMDSLRYWVTEMHVDGFRFDLASTLARELHDVDRLSSFFDIIHQDPIMSQVEADRRAVGRGRGRLPGGELPGALGGVERQVPRHGAPLLEGRRGHALRPRLPPYRKQRPLPA